MGKTAVFVISILQLIDKEDLQQDKPVCLVLAHCRELAYQITQEFERFKRHSPEIRTASVFGGLPVHLDQAKLRDEKPHIIVGTPGRMLHLVQGRLLDVSSVKYFVVDEADIVLETLSKLFSLSFSYPTLGMRSDVQRIFARTPREKQVMMFSATLSEETRALSRRFMHNVTISSRELADFKLAD
jgi:ATP-dependent RNA helicase UAP56/SUB2